MAATLKYEFVIIYLVGKLLSKLKRIKISALCVYFKGFIAKIGK